MPPPARLVAPHDPHIIRDVERFSSETLCLGELAGAGSRVGKSTRSLSWLSRVVSKQVGGGAGQSMVGFHREERNNRDNMFPISLLFLIVFICSSLAFSVVEGGKNCSTLSRFISLPYPCHIPNIPLSLLCHLLVISSCPGVSPSPPAQLSSTWSPR